MFAAHKQLFWLLFGWPKGRNKARFIYYSFALFAFYIFKELHVLLFKNILRHEFNRQ